MTKNAIIENRLVRDPMITDAEYLYQKRQEAERSEKTGRPQNLDIGKIAATVNMLEMLGGLARITEGRKEHHMMAAARFRTIHSLAQIGNARSIDYEAIRVDGEPARRTPLEIGDSARREYREVIQVLGMRLGALIENVIIYDRPVRAIAIGYGYGESGTARRKIREELLYGLDIMAEHMRLRTRTNRA